MTVLLELSSSMAVAVIPTVEPFVAFSTIVFVVVSVSVEGVTSNSSTLVRSIVSVTKISLIELSLIPIDSKVIYSPSMLIEELILSP